jgi:hypothetical protein
MSSVAYAYLDQYKGSFQFLVDCRDYYNEYGRLGHMHIRGVLNSMLADPNVVNMPVPVRTRFNAHSFDSDLPSVSEVLLNQSRKPYTGRPLTIPLPTRWRYIFGASNHKRSFVVHKVDVGRSCGVLHRADNTIRWTFHWQCVSHSPPRPYENTVALFSLDDAVLMVQSGDASHVPTLTVGEKVRPWKWCRACESADA